MYDTYCDYNIQKYQTLLALHFTVPATPHKTCKRVRGTPMSYLYCFQTCKPSQASCTSLKFQNINKMSYLTQSLQFHLIQLDSSPP